MAAKLTTVHPPKHFAYSWPTTGLVQVGPAVPHTFGHKHDVFLDGELIGGLETYVKTPYTKIPGTRLRRDLKPRKVWKPLSEGFSRVTYDLRWDAVRVVLEDHLRPRG